MIGYIQLYFKLEFTNGQTAYANWESDFCKPEGVIDAINSIDDMYKTYYKEKFELECSNLTFITKEEYEEYKVNNKIEKETITLEDGKFTVE